MLRGVKEAIFSLVFDVSSDNNIYLLTEDRKVLVQVHVARAKSEVSSEFKQVSIPF